MELARGRLPRGLVGLLGCLAATLLLPAATAEAADTLYWTTGTDSTNAEIHAGALAGGGTITTLYGPGGASAVAVDAASGRLLWTDFGLNATRGGPLAGGTTDTLFSNAQEGGSMGIAFDTAADLIYWARDEFPSTTDDTIRRGPVAGMTASTELFDAADGVVDPAGIAIDPASGKIYWANFSANTIASGPIGGGVASGTLYGSGDGVASPVGLAVDPVGGWVYWSNHFSHEIKRAPLAGGGPVVTLYDGTDGISTPVGIALDPAGNRLYIALLGGDMIKGAPADGSGPVDLLHDDGGMDQIQFIAGLRAPAAAGVPVVTGGGQAGQPLSCTQGTWGNDQPSGQFYRAPQSFAFQWQLNGADVAGATSASFTPTSGGSYTCRETATNHAGSTSQTSAPFAVAATPAAAIAKVCRTLLQKRRRQRQNLARAETKEKHQLVAANLGDTNRRIRNGFCRGSA